MDPNPVWNRIEQLERLVVSQANEIEVLKRSIQRINAQQSLAELQRNDDDEPNHRYSREARYSSRAADRRDYNIRTPPHVAFYSQSPTTYAAHSYKMNSFVHPPSAIPPRGSARWQQPYQETLRLANGRPTATLRSPPRTPPIQSPHLSPLPNKRWSAAPNLGLAPNDDQEIGDLGDYNDLDESDVHPKHSRQRFVEPSCAVIGSKKGSLAPEAAARPPSEPDDEEIDVEKLIDSGDDEHVEINVVSYDHASPPPPPIAPPCPPPSTSMAVALVEKQQEIIRIQSDSSDSEVEEIGRIAPKPRKVLVERKPIKVVARVAHKKKRWSLVKIEPSANNCGGGSSDYRRTYNRPTHTTTKTALKTVPKKVRSRSKSPEVQDQSWIWSRDPSQKRLSLPAELKDIIRKSPF